MHQTAKAVQVRRTSVAAGAAAQRDFPQLRL